MEERGKDKDVEGMEIDRHTHDPWRRSKQKEGSEDDVCPFANTCQQKHGKRK